MVCERSSTSPLCSETTGHISLHMSEGGKYVPGLWFQNQEMLHKVR